MQCYALTTFLRKRGHEVRLLRSDLKGEVSWKYRLNSFTKCSVFRNFRKNYLPPEVSPLEKIDFEDLVRGDDVILSIYDSQLELMEKGSESIKADQVQLGTQRMKLENVW